MLLRGMLHGGQEEGKKGSRRAGEVDSDAVADPEGAKGPCPPNSRPSE